MTTIFSLFAWSIAARRSESQVREVATWGCTTTGTKDFFHRLGSLGLRYMVTPHLNSICNPQEPPSYSNQGYLRDSTVLAPRAPASSIAATSSMTSLVAPQRSPLHSAENSYDSTFPTMFPWSIDGGDFRTSSELFQ